MDGKENWILLTAFPVIPEQTERKHYFKIFV